MHGVLFQSLCSTWHFAFPFLLLCVSFVKDWVVVYPLILSKHCVPFQMMAMFWQGKQMSRLEAPPGGPAECVVTPGEECSDLLHLELKAPMLCFWQSRREHGGLNCWSWSAVLLSPASITPPLSPALSSPWRMGKIAEGFVENYATHIETGKLPFPDRKSRERS